MTELVLIRHGETAGNLRLTALGTTDLPLTETGRAQAEALAEKLKTYAPDALYASPLVRAQETAKAIGIACGVPVTTVPDLAERNFGIWENTAVEDIKSRYPEAYAAWQKDKADYRIPGGETARENYNRVSRALDDILTRHQSGRVLIVSHLGSIRNMLAYLLGQEVERAWEHHIENGSFCRVQIEEGKNVTKVTFNEI